MSVVKAVAPAVGAVVAVAVAAVVAVAVAVVAVPLLERGPAQVQNKLKGCV
jgi:hypothetical protein